MENNIISFRLKSSHNEYIITMKLLNDKEPQKLEISLIHILKTGNISFLLQKSKEELINENKFLSELNSIKEIFDYFVKIIKSHNMQIIKPNSLFIFSYYIEFFDKEKHLSIPILLPRETSPTKKSKKKIEKIEKEKLIKSSKIIIIISIRIVILFTIIIIILIAILIIIIIIFMAILIIIIIFLFWF